MKFMYTQSTTMPSRYTWESEFKGTIGESEFDDTPAAEHLEDAIITRIVVWHTPYVQSVTVQYKGDMPRPVTHGFQTGEVSEFVLESGELITAVQGTVYAKVIGSIGFVTTRRIWGNFGTKEGEAFTLMPGPGTSNTLNMGLMSLGGWVGHKYIRGVRAKFASHSYASSRPATIRYEDQGLVVRQEKGSALLSRFASKLKSTIIHLLVGEERICFYAAKDILCQLPFFRAALCGEFLEASSNSIELPEDSPEAIGMLLEFLYTGSYTYAYTSSSEKQTAVAKESVIPAGTVEEMALHICVFTLASKYDCPELGDIAMAGAACVVKDLEGMEIVRFLTIVYGKGVLLADFAKSEGMKGFLEGLSECMRGLYLTHAEEINRAVMEYPELGRDLLFHVFTT